MVQGKGDITSEGRGRNESTTSFARDHLQDYPPSRHELFTHPYTHTHRHTFADRSLTQSASESARARLPRDIFTNTSLPSSSDPAHNHALDEQHAGLRLPAIAATSATTSATATRRRRRAPNTTTSKHAKARAGQRHRMGIRTAEQLGRRRCAGRFRWRGGGWCCARWCAWDGTEANAVEWFCPGYGRWRCAGAD